MKNLFLFFTLSVLSVGKNFALATSFRKVVAYQKKDVRFTVFTDGVMGREWRSSGQYTEDPFYGGGKKFTCPGI